MVKRIKQAKHGPEYYIQQDFIEFLEERGWLVERMIGNAFQKGIPDLYCFHPKWGERWVDLKRPVGGRLTKDQILKWPTWEAFGCGIWIITAATQQEYDKLWKPPNWRLWWKSSYNAKYDIDQLLSEIV